jgi:hypothetical protein
MIINGLENKDHSGWTRSGDLVRGGILDDGLGRLRLTERFRCSGQKGID